MKYLAKLDYCFAEEDIYGEGCTGDSTDKTFNLEFKADSVENLKDKVTSFLGTTSIEKDGEHWRVARHETQTGDVASEREIEQWKNGEKRLWYVDFGFTFYKTETI